MDTNIEEMVSELALTPYQLKQVKRLLNMAKLAGRIESMQRK